jgi:hypothetical protein
MVITRLPVKKTGVVILNPEISGLISKLDTESSSAQVSGSRKGNTCIKSAKFFEQIILFEPFGILPKEFSQGVLQTFGSQPVLNPEESGCGMTPEGF